jgi:hypothetical protein
MMPGESPDLLWVSSKVATVAIADATDCRAVAYAEILDISDSQT